MRAFGIAKIVGTTTKGGVHPAVWHIVHPHFAVQVPEFRIINAATNAEDREGAGLTPDIVAASEDALGAALAEARREQASEGG